MKKIVRKAVIKRTAVVNQNKRRVWIWCSRRENGGMWVEKTVCVNNSSLYDNKLNSYSSCHGCVEWLNGG